MLKLELPLMDMHTPHVPRRRLESTYEQGGEVAMGCSL